MVDVDVRRLRYRLARQGMLELDRWLQPLLSADFHQDNVATAVEYLLQREPPELQAMMQGEMDIPEVLAEWLI